MKKFNLVIMLGFCIIISLASISTAWWDGGWTYRRNMTIDSSKINSDLTNFTIVLWLNNSNFNFTDAQSGGEDIRIVNSTDDGLLFHEIEFWNSTDAYVWIRFPHVSSTVDTAFYVYYKNLGASDGQDADNTWDDDYAMTVHFNEEPNGTLLDSSGEGYTFTGNNFVSTDRITGQIGYATDNVDTGNYANCSVSCYDPDVLTEFSWVFWSLAHDNVTNVNEEYIITIPQDAGQGHIYVDHHTPTADPSFGPNTKFAVGTGTTIQHEIYRPLAQDEWVFYVGTAVNNSDRVFYANGVEVSRNESNLSFGDASSTMYFFTSPAVNKEFNGSLDAFRFLDKEVRIDWVNATYYSETFRLLNFEEGFDYTFIENSQSYSATTVEGSTENFKINISYNSSEYLNQNVTFYYNGSPYSASKIGDGDTVEFERTIVIPGTISETNYSFYWNVELIRSGGSSVSGISRSYNQTVSNLSADNCTAFSYKIFNFTLIDEENQNLLTINTTIETAFNLYSLDRTTNILNYSDSFNASVLSLCLSQNVTGPEKYSLDIVIKYSAQDHVTEYYNIINYTLDNESSQDPSSIFLYDLQTADNTDFRFTFTGSDFLPVEDALVYVERQYISENVFKTVELPKTDSNGQTILHLVRNDILYNLRVVKNGVVLATLENARAYCEDFTIGDCQINLNAFQTGTPIFDYDGEIGLIYSGPNFDNSTNVASFEFVTEDGTSRTVLMEVSRNDVFGNRTLCSDTLTSASGSLSCAVGNLDDTLIIVRIYVDGDKVLEDRIIINWEGYGAAGNFLAFIFILAFILMFGKSKNTQLIGVLLGFITAIGLGLLKGAIIGVGATGMWLIIIVIIFIWKLNKEKES